MMQDHIADQDGMTQRRDCYYCTKHRTGEDAPPGGWLVADGDWLVGHGPAHMSLPGTLRIESRRHFTDFADMTDAEAASFGLLLASLYRAVRLVTGAERIHLLATMDYQPHFHAWLYPRAADDPRRGTAFLHHGFECTDADAQTAAAAIRSHLAPPARRARG
jgi:diadenosine tetraphosphate (Ap4A) HIT family hydrolase